MDPTEELAVPDAKGIASGLEKSGTGLYEGIEVKTLTDTQVTADGLDKTFTELSVRCVRRTC